VRIGFNLAAIGRTKWYEYVIRFLFGGAITAITGVLAKKFGPGFAGLFLAFPAIFPASATLVEKHQRQKKQRAGASRINRGREAAALDAAGASIGSVGLFAFAAVAWRLLPEYGGGIVLLLSTLVWAIVSGLLWRLRKAI
jgi:Protein of unknown function (DUF3147)